MRRACLGALALVFVLLPCSSALWAQAAATSQTQKPTFRTSVEYVEVDARVVDGKGAPVRSLKKEDFHLFEDGKEQTIESFAAIDIPVETTSSTNATETTADVARVDPPVESDVARNQYGADESRVYVIVLDDRQIDAHRTFNTIKIVRTFIQRNLGSHDLAAIVTTSGRTDISQTLTGNKTLLLKALEGFMGRKLESYAIETFNGTAPQTDAEWFHEAHAALRAVGDVVTWMAGMRGRSKVLLLMSEGTQANYDAFSGDATMFLEQERQTIAAATRANVAVYTIDPRGLYAYDELTSLGSSTSAGVAAAVAAATARERGGPVPQAAGMVGGAEWTTLNRAFRAEVDRAQMSLRLVADATGGAAAVGTNNFQAVLDRMVTEHSTYYLLGYYPKNTRRDGKNRTIDVRVKGMKVVARRGYREANGAATAPPPALPGPPGTSAELRDALNSPVPVDGVSLIATAAAFRSEGGKASITVILESPAGNIELVEQDGKFVGAVEMTTVAIDRRNAVAAGETTNTNLQLTRESSERLKQLGFRALSKLDNVSPGAHQVRAAIGLRGSSKRGSVWYDIDVPDFSKGDLAMSSLVIASAQQGAMPTGNAGKLFAGVLSIPPTAVRQFRAADELIVFAELYANHTPALDASVAVLVSKADRTGVVIRREDAVPANAFESGDGVHRYVTRLGLEDLAPGEYVLSVEAAPRADNAQMIIRAVPFQVLPR